MPLPGDGQSNAFFLSGGPYAPEQRTAIEKQHISHVYANGMPDGSSWDWQWVETRTFPANGRTYDIVGANVPVGDAVTHRELWFDVTDVLTPAEKGSLSIRAKTAPPVKLST